MSRKLTALNSGNVGISATNPKGALHILTAGAPPAALSASENGLLLGVNSTTTYKWIQSYGGPLSINTQGNNVGIGTTNPTEKLHVIGNILASGNITSNSDVRFKREIEPLDSALEMVKQLEGKYYYWKDDYMANQANNQERQIGFIAQEMEQIIPELVRTDQEGYKAINYAQLTPVLVEAIKEQSEEIHSLKEKLELLQQQVADMQKQLLTKE